VAQLNTNEYLTCPAIVETPAHPGEARSVISLKAMYNGCMDTDTIEAAGLGPLLEVAAGGWPLIQNNWNGDRLELL
jgi:hypothetical protein